MRRRLVHLLAVALLLVVSLAGAATAAPLAAADGDLESFVTLLRGEAVNPPVTTRAVGVASFLHSPGSPGIDYSVGAVLPGRRPTAVHIHLGAVGENGPVVVDLGTGPRGTVTADDLVGPLAGADTAALVDLMRSGGVYVDVHSALFPEGELRGQIHGRRGAG